MRLYASLWNGEGWATRGGLVKTDWTKAPFTASFKSYNPNGCVWTNAASWCCQNSAPWLSEALDSGNQKMLRWVQKNYMIYNYCSDKNRFPQGLPRECTVLPTKPQNMIPTLKSNIYIYIYFLFLFDLFSLISCLCFPFVYLLHFMLLNKLIK